VKLTENIAAMSDDAKTNTARYWYACIDMQVSANDNRLDIFWTNTQFKTSHPYLSIKPLMCDGSYLQHGGHLIHRRMIFHGHLSHGQDLNCRGHQSRHCRTGGLGQIATDNAITVVSSIGIGQAVAAGRIIHRLKQFAVRAGRVIIAATVLVCDTILSSTVIFVGRKWWWCESLIPYCHVREIAGEFRQHAVQKEYKQSQDRQVVRTAANGNEPKQLQRHTAILYMNNSTQYLA
jgi:hypothetical protein